MDLKQLELDTAAAKVDELSKQLESLWTDHPGPPALPSLVRQRRRGQGHSGVAWGLPGCQRGSIKRFQVNWALLCGPGRRTGDVIHGKLQLCHSASPGTCILWCQAILGEGLSLSLEGGQAAPWICSRGSGAEKLETKPPPPRVPQSLLSSFE